MQNHSEPAGLAREGGDDIAPGPDHHHTDSLSAEAIHNLRAPLTVIKAQAQMLERWVRRNDIADANAVLARLLVIDGMVVRLADELDLLREPPPTDESGETADGGR